MRNTADAFEGSNVHINLAGTGQLIDSSGAAPKTTSAVIVQLTSTSPTGQFLDASGNVLSKGRLTLSAGSNSATVEYRDSQAGFPTLTATENGFSATTQVNVGVTMVFTTPAQSIKAGQQSKTITVQLQDGNGNAFLAPSNLQINTNSDSSTGQFLDNSGKPISYLGLSIAAGSSSVSFKYQDSVGGKPTLTVSAMSPSGVEINSGQQETIAGPYKVMFFTAQPLSAIPQNKASQLIKVQLIDSTGNVTAPTSPVIVQLASTSTTGVFLNSSGTVLTGGRLTIPAGSNAASFEYRDSQISFPTLTATENGFSTTTQVNVGVSLVYTSPAQSIKTGARSGNITVRLQDSHGTAFVTPIDLNLTLSSSQDSVQFLGLPSPLIPYGVLIPAGSSSSSFAITSSWGGTPTLTLSSPNLALSATQKETIQGLSGLVFTTPAQTVTAGQMSDLVTLHLVDNNGKAVVAPVGGLTIDLSGNTPYPSTSPTLTFFDAKGNPLPASDNPYSIGSSILMPAGSGAVSFEFQSTQAGVLPLYAGIRNGPWTKQVETFQAGSPKSLVFQTPAQSLAAGMSSGSITVQFQDKYGNPITAGSGGLKITLHTTSSGGAFLSADGEPLTSSSIILPQGQNSATFEYKDSRVGTPTLTVTASGVSGTQTESITPVSAEIHVTNTKDSGSGSLRAAILAADTHPGSTIVFDAGVRGTIDLLRALPVITASTNIVGPGASLLTIERSAAASTDFGIFVVGASNNPVGPTVVISGLTVANGTGTGITNNLGYLTLQRVVVRNNQAAVTDFPNANMIPYGSAGGIENFGALTVLNSTIANNTTTRTLVAAGIDSEFGSVLIVNSTISGNKEINSYRSGGIGIYGGSALIESSTISGNVSLQPLYATDSYSGGIDSDGQVTLYDTLVAGNTGSANNPTDVSGAFISLGHNLIGAANQQSSGFVSSDLVGTIARPIDPKLGALANNGGPTPTLALLAGSPALRAGSSVNAPSTDQRGDPRPQGAVDIGAFEETTS